MVTCALFLLAFALAALLAATVALLGEAIRLTEQLLALLTEDSTP